MLQARIKASAPTAVFDVPDSRHATAISRLISSIEATGVQSSWRAIGQLITNNAPESHYSTQAIDRLEIHDIYRPHDYKGPSDLQMLIGRAFVPLGLLGQCDIGRICLQQLFFKMGTQGRDGKCLSGAEIRQMLNEWHSPTVSFCPYELSPSINGFKIRWNSFHEWEYYSIDDLMKTRAGRFLVEDRRPRISLRRTSWDLIHYLQHAEELQRCPNLSVPFNPTEAIAEPVEAEPKHSWACPGPADRQRARDTDTSSRYFEGLTTSGTCAFDWDEEEEGSCFTDLGYRLRALAFSLVTSVPCYRSS